VLAIALLSACSEDDASPCPESDEAGACLRVEQDAGCPGLDEGCSIASAHCQQQIFAATACVRGQPDATLPPVRMITRDEYAAELRVDAPAEDDFGTRVWGTGLGLFGLVPREQSLQASDIEQQVASIAAFYRRDQKNVTIISDTSLDPTRAALTLSHEFVHALQDQREGLQAFYDVHATSSDANLALKCITEGEAVLLSNLTSLHLRGIDLGDTDFDRYFQNWLTDKLEEVGEAKAPLLASRLLVYPLGGAGMWRAFEAGGLSALGQFYVEPAHTLQSWADGLDGVREPQALDCAEPSPPPGLALRFFDRHGYAGLLSLYVGLGGGVREPEARSWRSDAFALYSDPTEVSEAVAVAWRQRLASEADAAQLAEFVAASGQSIETHVQGQEVLLIAATDAELLASWSARTACGSPAKVRHSGLRPRAPRWLHDPYTP
jgi:hypothetical protein